MLTATVLAMLVAGCNLQKREGEQMTPPNIIYVLADDLGYGDLGCFNPDSKIATPHLNRMATEGMRFTDAHSSSAVCTPTRYGLLTGRYNWRTSKKNGVLKGYSPALIDEDRETVATLLHARGYHTSFIGKWHLGWNWAKDSTGRVDFSGAVERTPNSNGFDYAYGHCGSLDMPPYVYVENGQPTAIPIKSTENKDEQGYWRKGLTAPDFIHEEVTPNFVGRAINMVKQQAKTGKPFFIYLPLPSPHTPILPTPEWQGKSGLNPYGDFVMMVDDFMGQLMEAIREAGVEENTLVIFTSDNGCSPRANFEQLAEKGHYPSSIFRGSKADIFEGGHRVPFIARWPSGINAGSSCDQTICLTDLMATCADILGQVLPDNVGEDSYSLLPLFRKPATDDYLREACVHHSINGSFAIRKGDWKLILCPDSGGWSYPHPRKDTLVDPLPFQLYNLAADPGETNNVYASQTEVAKELQKVLTAYIENGRSTPGEPQQNDPVKDWPQTAWMNQ